MALSVDEQQEIGERAAKILSKVELKSFKLSPQTIMPFEEAELSWEVTGEDPGFSVRLNGASVAKSGHATVNPIFTTRYTIEAVAFGKSRRLSQVTLVVNHDDCYQNGIGDGPLGGVVQTKLAELIQSGSEITIRQPSRVAVHSGRIEIHVFLRSFLHPLFTADLDVTLKFSLGFTPGREVQTKLLDVEAVASQFITLPLLQSGIVAIVQLIAEQVIAGCVKAFLGPQLEDALATGIQTTVSTLCEAAGYPRIVWIAAVEGEVRWECCGLSQGARFTDVLQSSNLSTGELHV